jgi:hypothetical protein
MDAKKSTAAILSHPSRTRTRAAIKKLRGSLKGFGVMKSMLRDRALERAR